MVWETDPVSTEKRGAPLPPKAPDDVQVMDTGAQPFLSRASRRAAVDELGRDVELPPIAHVPRYLSLITTIVAAILVAVSASAGESFLAIALTLGGLIIAWGWPKAAGLPSPKGSSVVLALTALALVLAVLVAEGEPYLRWAPAALAFGLIAMFVHQLLRRDGRPRLTESVMGTSLGLAILASGTAYLPLAYLDIGPELIACAMAAIAASTLADLLVRIGPVRMWLLPLSMVLGGFASVATSLFVAAPDLPPAALIGVSAAGLSHLVRRMLSPEAGSYSSQGQIASAAASIAMVGGLLWSINDLIVR